MERKLAVILAADVAGYSALMEADEAGTFERLRSRRRDLLEPEISKHHGRIFKLMGDGLLAEFGSVVDAVECAVTLQRGMMERNTSVSEENRIEIRIGINLGEVIVEGDDRYGEGVNVAARLQELADPGGICVSSKVSKEVEKKLAFSFESMGERQVKNITEPIACYRVSLHLHPTETPLSSNDRQPSKAATTEEAIALALPDKPSIAVLPFQNMSGDPEQEYFTDGMVEEIITALSRIRWLFVIARNSSFTYKGRAVDVKQVGRELGVRYVLEGSVRKAGNRVRITASSSMPPPPHIFGPSVSKVAWRMCSICKIKSRPASSARLRRSSSRRRSSAPNASRPTASTLTTTISAGWQASTRSPQRGRMRSARRCRSLTGQSSSTLNLPQPMEWQRGAMSCAETMGG
jgi:adenylate cyclase